MSKFLNKYIFIIIGILVFWLGIIPLLFAKALPVICENITYNSEYNIELQKPRLILNIIPTATVKADSIKITKKNSKDFFFADNPKISLRLLPLLSGIMHINKISSSNIEMCLNIPENTKLDKNFLDNLENTKVKLDAAGIEKFVILLNENNVPIKYEGNSIRYRKNSRYIRFFIDSKISLNDKQSDIFINLFLPRNNDVKKSDMEIKITNFDISPLCDFFKNYLPKDLKNVKGIINIDANKNNLNANLKNVAIQMTDEANSMIFPDELKIASNYSLTRKSIFIENADIKSKNINTSFSGTISNYLDKILPSVDLNVRINKSRIEDFISMMPPIQTEDINGYKLKKYKFYGDIIGNFTVKGDTLEPSVNGDLYITNGILTKPIPNAKGATIKITFVGKYLNFDVAVPAGLTEKVWVKGGVELYNIKYSDMRIWSTKTVDLETAQSKVVPLHEILNFVIGPVPIMDIKGIGNIDIVVKGNRKDPHVWGVFNVNRTKTFFLEIPNLVLTDADAVLSFDDENAVFKTSKGFVNGQPFDIKGTCNLSGKFDFDVFSNKQEIGYLYNAIKTSSLIEDIRTMLPNLDIVSGLANLKIKVYGNIKDINLVKYKENFFTKGEITLLGNSFGMNGIKIADVKGKASYEDTNASYEATARIDKYPLTSKGSIQEGIANVSLNIPSININSLLPKQEEDFGNILVSINTDYKGRVDKIDYDKINFVANILGTSPSNKLKISKGQILLNKGKLNVKDVNGHFDNSKSSFNLDFSVDKISSNPNINGKIQLKEFELQIINIFKNCILLPAETRNALKKVKFDRGKINLKADIRNNNVNTSTNIGGVELTYTPLDLPLKIVNGSIYLKHNFLGLNKINILADGMPILIDGGISDIFSKQNFDLYINSKPQQSFIDKYINNNHIYPIKVKGDIVYQVKLRGIKDNFDISSLANIARDSSIYYLGATVGDVENAILLNLDMNVLKQNIYKIKEFSYDKIIASQNAKQTKLNMLKANGAVEVLKNDLIFNNLHIKTHNPTDARIFNVIFRKPNIKQGQFTSDLKLNGRLSNPKINGSFHIFETNIPFMDTSLKNITLLFKDKNIEISSLGEILGNDIKFKGKMKNSLKPPFYIEDAELFTKIIDLNYITERLKEAQVAETNSFEPIESLDLRYFVIKNIKMGANSIRLRNILAENIEASASLSEKHDLNVNNFKFKMANGTLGGSFNYNFGNNKTRLKLRADNIDANSITYAVFNLNNQIYGELTGSMDLSCNGSGFDKCMETLNGNANFNVSNGRMPKLGSLEYLLRAGNLLKGGLTNLSINGVIDIITPMKTGEFSNIYGVIGIKDGVAKTIEISTKGKDLSLFITGTYNFSTSIAEMEVLGMLSKKISTMFGPLGNVSLNSLFNIIPGVDLSKDTSLRDKINKIPGIELSSKAYRKFVAEIFGNINNEGYVQTFKWIN